MCLAGGPGGNTQYLTRLGELANGDLQVLIHDQLGTGKSDRPDDPILWNFPRVVEEVETVRSELNLGKVPSCSEVKTSTLLRGEDIDSKGSRLSAVDVDPRVYGTGRQDEVEVELGSELDVVTRLARRAFGSERTIRSHRCILKEIHGSRNRAQVEPQLSSCGEEVLVAVRV